MAIIKCKMCGGDLEVTPGATVAECEYCGTKQTLPKANDEVVQNLFNRANNLRIKCEFDKAEQIYEKILQENDEESEAHWGIVLCKYGIEYVEDPKTYKRIPTCHRTSYDAVTTDADYLSAVENADGAQRSVYEAEAKAIDEIQKNILNIVKNEKPFDVFICYKETDENGKRTIDSTIANDIYYQLTQEGLKVFYAAITLEDKLGQEYEPYIFAALNSAKVMLVIGTKPQYFSAVWVKNEWSRFLRLMKTDRSKLLIPCYKDMDAYDLPEEFAHLQAQDMGKIGFINDVVRGIKKVTDKGEPQPTVVKETVVTGNTNALPLLERAFMFLEDGDWERADDFCEQVLNLDPKNAQAYLGKLMAELRVKKQENLQECEKPFDENNHYQKAIRFADDALKATLIGYIDHINTRNENARKDRVYRDAEAKMDGKSIADCEAAIHLFASIPGWKDADKQIDVCREMIQELEAQEEAERLEQESKAEIARQEAERKAQKNKKIGTVVALSVVAMIAFVIILYTVIIPNGKYNDAMALMDAEEYTEAISAFLALDGYKDCVDKITECNAAIIEIKYNDAIAWMNEGNIIEAYEALIALGGYKDSKNQANSIYDKYNIAVMERKYNDAIAWMNEGNIIEAYEALIALDGYKDSKDKANSVYEKYKAEKLKFAKTGDSVFFGTYEQDNNTSNSKEDIEWLVLEVKDKKALVISKYALDCKMFTNTESYDNTWENCTLRVWLNKDFVHTAFTADERARISSVTVTADKNPKWDTNPGNATQDQVFLLSITEANKYFDSDSARRCETTNYAVAGGVNVDKDNSTWWWLRSPGENEQAVAVGCPDGTVYEGGFGYHAHAGAVRPAMWINLNS